MNLMPGPKPLVLNLTDEERHGLEKLTKRHSSPQQLVLRARIVFAADDGKYNAQITRDLDIEVQTVRRWRNCWLLLQPIPLKEPSIQERLEDLPRPGAPPRITADQRCPIEALACEDPEDSKRPISHWTGREVAEEIMKRGIIDNISARPARRLQKRGPISNPT
jgi:putative transposase